MTLHGEELNALLGEVVTHAGVVADDGACVDQRAAHWVVELARLHPRDPGVLAPLLLRLVALEPGEGLFVGSGVLHSYLHGAGVEVQASSDNVLRAGLTSKKVDLHELLRVMVGDHGPQPLVHPRRISAGLDSYDVPVDDFAVWRVAPAGSSVDMTAPGPVIVVCVDGEVEVGGAVLTAGSAAYLPGGRSELTVAGSGTCFVTAGGPGSTKSG